MMDDDNDSLTTGGSIASAWHAEGIEESKYGNEPEPLVSQKKVEIEQLRRLRKLNERRFLRDTEERTTKACHDDLDPVKKEELKRQLDEKLRRLEAEEIELEKQMNRLFKHVKYGNLSQEEPVPASISRSRKILLCEGDEKVTDRVNSKLKEVVLEYKRIIQTLRRETWMTIVVERVEDMSDYTVRVLQRRHSRDGPIHRNVAVRVRVSSCLTHLEWKTSDGELYKVEVARIAAIFCGDTKEAVQMGVQAKHIFRLHIADTHVPLQFAASNENQRNDWVAGLAMIQYLSPLTTMDASLT